MNSDNGVVCTQPRVVGCMLNRLSVCASQANMKNLNYSVRTTFDVNLLEIINKLNATILVKIKIQKVVCYS